MVEPAEELLELRRSVLRYDAPTEPVGLDEWEILSGASGSAATLSPDETRRYARHLILPEVGREGQARLRGARVLLVGAGGLGSPAALYLAAAGVGTLGLVDDDVVDLSNLQRQPLHGTSDVGRSKLDSAADRLADVNPHVTVERHPVRLSSANALALFEDYGLVIDGSDNFPTRYLVNDAGILTGTPVVYGSIHQFEGQCSLFGAPGGPCYRCLFAEPPPAGLVPSCAEAGVLGVLPGVVGSLQATEALKWLLGIGDPLVGRLLRFDALRMRFREIRVPRDPACPVCGDQPTVTTLIDYERFCGLAPRNGRDDIMTQENDIPEITAGDLKTRLDRGDPMTIIDVREPGEWEICNLEQYGARLIPLGDLPERVGEIPPDEPVVLHCRSGGRSGQALEYLRQRGHGDLYNLRGGILAWSDEVDPSVPKY